MANFPRRGIELLRQIAQHMQNVRVNARRYAENREKLSRAKIRGALLTWLQDRDDASLELALSTIDDEERDTSKGPQEFDIRIGHDLKTLRDQVRMRWDSLAQEARDVLERFEVFQEDPFAGPKVRKTIAVCDLKGYGGREQFLRGFLPDAVPALVERVQRYVRHALERIEMTRDEAVFKTEGDKATLQFDWPTDAHRWAQALHLVASGDRSRRPDGTEDIYQFRVAIATGHVVLCPEELMPSSGSPLMDAARLEPSATPGGTLIDVPTYDLISSEYRGLYEDQPELISGKSGEAPILAHRSRSHSPAPNIG